MIRILPTQEQTKESCKASRRSIRCGAACRNDQVLLKRIPTSIKYSQIHNFKFPLILLKHVIKI